MTVREIISGAALALFTTVAAGAQPTPALSDLAMAYENGNYQRVVALAESSAAGTAPVSRGDRAYVLTYWAFSLVALSRDDEASDKFQELLKLKPATDLNPEFVSPKIIAVFRKAKEEYIRSVAPPGGGSKLLVDTHRPSKPGALIRTLVWPGWGQSYRGQIKKGRIFKIASLAAVAGLGASEAGAFFSHRDYLDARDADRINATYTTYNHWYRFRNLTVNLTVSVWVLAVVDVMMGD